MHRFSAAGRTAGLIPAPFSSLCAFQKVPTALRRPHELNYLAVKVMPPSTEAIWPPWTARSILLKSYTEMRSVGVVVGCGSAAGDPAMVSSRRDTGGHGGVPIEFGDEWASVFRCGRSG